VPESHRFCLSCGTDTSRTAETKDPLVGKTLVGKYTVASVLGSGAMGTIYKAEQTALGKAVVIKVLHRHLLTDPELIQRFHREARAASRLNHPNCVQIMDFGALDDGSLYIAMEYIQGIDLATLLEREHPIDHRRLIGIVKQVCQALDEAHANGVLHRDLKPENIMIEDRRTVRDHVKVVDFGIAKLEENNPGSRRSFQTRTGIVCGTPEYMSPEQARGMKLDARSDLYAVGVMLYHLTTDHLPFDAPSPIEVVTKHISELPRPPIELRADMPEALNRLVLTLLEKDREKRPSSALDVNAELERIDRELAAQRREKVESKYSDDATMVDMRPISDLVNAIDLQTASIVPKGGTLSASDAASDVVAAQDAVTTQRAKDTSKAAVAGTATDMSMGDTVPEALGRDLGKRVQAQTKDVRPPKTPPGGTAGVASSPKTIAQKVKALEPAPALRGPSSGTKAPNAPLGREAITVAVKPYTGAQAVAELEGSSEAFANELEPSETPPKKRLWLWLAVGGVVAAAAAVIVVLVVT